MMNNFNFRLLLGTIFISYICYMRLFHVREPRELFTNLDMFKVIIYSLILSIMFFLFTYNIYKFFYKKNEKGIISAKYLNILKTIYQHPNNPLLILNNSLISLDAFLKNKLPDYNSRKTYAHLIIEIVTKYLIDKEKYSKLILTFFRILPQAIICTIFVVEVMFVHKFDYLYKFSWLLIIPLIIRYIIHSIKIHTETHLESLNDILILKVINKKDIDDSVTLYDPININKCTNVSIDAWYLIGRKSYTAENSEEVICLIVLGEELMSQLDTDYEQRDTLKFCIDSLQMFFNFRFFMQNYEEFKDSIEVPFNIVKYSFYSIGWCYIIIYGIS